MSDHGKPLNSDFAAAGQERGHGVVREIWTFLATNKKWWLLPVFTALLILGVLAMAGSTAAAPFIYTLF
jgi:hypothetical protein